MSFTVINRNIQSKARSGVLTTDRGIIETPIFMPVGTLGTVKGVHQQELKEQVKAKIILGNTYHLYLRPGLEIIEKAKGLHKFINWDLPILTDSGGYQVFSLKSQCKISNLGATFSSHIDGSKHLFTPENVVDTQRKLGSDIMMALDVCPPHPVSYKTAQESLQLTFDWLQRGIFQFEKTDPTYNHSQIFVPITQGSIFEDLRIKSSQFVSEYTSSVYAIGGLSVGESEEELYRMVNISTDHLPTESARYLMGVGTPANILECIGLGIDMFDCVLPTRNARHGILYTSEGIINIKNAKWKNDLSPIDQASQLNTSQQHSKAYLRHLFSVKELLGPQLASLQNLSFYLWLMEEARAQIKVQNFNSWKNKIIAQINRRL